MEAKKVSTQIIDHIDGQPSIILSNGNWGVFDPKTNMYKDTGIKASPEDDSSAVKYYKLSNTPTPLEAPSQTGGWSTLASLNASLAQAEWAEDPLQTSSTNRFCWIATYGKENIVDTVATEAEGHLVFKPKFTRTNVRLWSNYANSPTIAVVGNEIIITNPDGTVIKQKFASTEAINDLTTLINSLQSQVDGAIYSYSMEGVPTLNTLPTTDWRLDNSGNPITNPATIADVYKTHVGDTYTDLLTYRSYRFSQTGSSSSDPSHYEWKIIEDDALSAALGEIAQLGREKITVFTVEPNKPYKKGDMWLDGEVMLHAIQGSEVFDLSHWVQPYATKAELSVIEADLQQAAGDAHSANQNLAALEANLTSMTGTVADAIKDNIISDTELMDLNAELKQLDIDQETLLTTVNYLLASIYLPATPKATLQTRSNNSIAVGGSMDIYQAQITTMITDKVITAQERADYLSKFNTYKTHLKLLNEAISGAKNAIEGELKRLADEKVDNIQIGGRNLLLNSNFKTTSFNGWSNVYGTQQITENGYLKTYTSDGNTRIEKNFTLNEIGTFTFSIKVKTNKAIAWHGWVDLEILNTKIKQIEDDFEIHSITFSNSIAGSKTIRGYQSSVPIGTTTLIEWEQLEKGTVATDWTPAPEDVQAEINALEDFSNEAFADGVVDRAEAKAIEKYINTVNESFESVKSTYDKMLLNSLLITAEKAKLTGKYTPLSTAKGNLITSITTAIADGVATKAEKADVDTKFGLYNTAMKAYQTALEEARIAMDVELKRLADEKVDNIEIGGRNLLTRAIMLESGTASERNGVNGVIIPVGIGKIFESLTFKENTQYSFFIDKEPQIAGGKDLVIQCWYTDGSSQTILSFADKRVQGSFVSTKGKTIESIRKVYNSTGSFFYGFQISESNVLLKGYTPAPEDIQAEIDSGVATVTTLYKNADEGVVVPKPTEANEVSSGWSETSPAKVDGQVIWSVNRVTLKNGTKVYSNPANIQGADGEGGINVMITRQGSFRTYWRQIGDQGQILTAPEKVSEIIGGVEIGGIKYIQCKVLIYKGSVDVTASALADPTTLPKWYLNNELMASVTDILNIPISHADGKDDEVRFEYTDTNAKNWKGI